MRRANRFGSTSAAAGAPAVDNQAPYIIVGNSLNGDLATSVDFLDVGDGVQLAAALASAGGGANRDVWIRPGVYDCNVGGVSPLTIPSDTLVRGAGMGHTTIRTRTSGDLGGFIMSAGAQLMDLTIDVPKPTGAGVGQTSVVAMSGNQNRCIRVNIDFNTGGNPLDYTAAEVGFTNLLYAWNVTAADPDFIYIIECSTRDGWMPALVADGGGVTSAVIRASASNCHIINSFIAGGDIGIMAAQAAQVNNCSIAAQTRGLTQEATCDEFIITGNHISTIGATGAERGIELSAISAGNNGGAVVSGNAILARLPGPDVGSVGILANSGGSTRAAITGNILENWEDAIEFTLGSVDSTAVSNVRRNCTNLVVDANAPGLNEIAHNI